MRADFPLTFNTTLASPLNSSTTKRQNNNIKISNSTHLFFNVMQGLIYKLKLLIQKNSNWNSHKNVWEWQNSLPNILTSFQVFSSFQVLAFYFCTIYMKCFVTKKQSRRSVTFSLAFKSWIKFTQIQFSLCKIQFFSLFTIDIQLMILHSINLTFLSMFHWTFYLLSLYKFFFIFYFCLERV